MARRFTFRLDTLLKVRRLHEQEAQRRLASKQAEIARVDQLNQQTNVEIREQQEALRAAQGQLGVDPVTLQRGRAWVGHLRRQIAERMRQRAGLMAQLDELQDALRQARTQTRIIEKLREKRLAAHTKETERQDQAAADELAQQLHEYEAH